MVARMKIKSRVRAGAGMQSALLAVSLVLFIGCAGDGGGGKSDSAATGGSTGRDAGAAGGAMAVGGAVTTGGATGAGGVTGSGGSVATGGTRAIDAGAGGTPGVDGGTGGSPGIDASLDQAQGIDAGSAGVDASRGEAGAIDTGHVGLDAGIDATSDSGVSDAPLAAGPCQVSFTSSTANLAAAATPISSGCIAQEYGDATHSQWNFGANDNVAGTMRFFNIDWFDITTPVGTTLKVEDGYNITTAWNGINVSYSESSPAFDQFTWTGDRGSVTLTAVSGKTFTVTVTAVHFTPTADISNQNQATGSFEMNGTIVATMP
jgi:hypothetical protein